MVGVGTTTALNDIPADETHKKDPNVCHYLPASPHLQPSPPAEYSCQSQSPTHEVASKESAEPSGNPTYLLKPQPFEFQR